MNKLKHQLIVLRFWQWAAMHSPYFQYFKFRFHRAPVSISIHSSKWTDELLVIRFVLNRPRLLVNTPYPAVQAFIKAQKEQGEIIDERVLDDILSNFQPPFVSKPKKKGARSTFLNILKGRKNND